jgi:hypothetical protein
MPVPGYSALWVVINGPKAESRKIG